MLFEVAIQRFGLVIVKFKLNELIWSMTSTIVSCRCFAILFHLFVADHVGFRINDSF